MQKYLSICIVLLSSVALAESGPPPEKAIWRACKKTDECVVAAGPCGPEAVNKKYQSVFEEHAIKLKPFVDCMPPEDVTRKAVCKKKKCVLE